MKKTILILLSLVYYFTANANQCDSKVLATVGKEKITYKMLEKAYNKNLSTEHTPLNKLNQDDFLEFLNRYTNYRLEVLDAIDKGYDKDEEVIKDIERNKLLLAESFYFESKLLNPNLEKLFERRKIEYKFAYIIIPKQKDTITNLTPHQRAEEVISKLEEGQSFAELAKEYSADKNTSENGGLVDKYLTAGKIQRPIENILYTLSPGEYYKDFIETKYGIFIIKLMEKTKRYYVKASHILLENDPDKNGSMEKRADEVLEALKNGEDFAELAKEYSGDVQTAFNGGSLGEYYSRSTGYASNGKALERNFEKALFALKDGGISQKIKTEFGIHIIKRVNSKDVNREEEMPILKKMYKKTFYDSDKIKFIDSLAKRFGYALYVKGLNSFQSKIDTILRNLDPSWSKGVTDEIKKELLFMFGDKTWTVGEFIDLTQSNSDLRGINLNDYGIYKATQKIIKPMIIKKATANLENEDKDFADLVKEFRDGIMLFKVKDEEVWQKRVFDSALAKVYYDSTKTRYKTNIEYNLGEIYILAQKEANSLFKEIIAENSFDKLVGLKTQRPKYREKNGQWGWVDSKTHRLGSLIDSDKAENGKVYSPISNGGGYSIFKINDIRPIRQKTFEEAIPEISPKVQDILQENLTKLWLSKVSKKHAVVINKSVINEIINN